MNFISMVLQCDAAPAHRGKSAPSCFAYCYHVMLGETTQVPSCLLIAGLLALLFGSFCSRMHGGTVPCVYFSHLFDFGGNRSSEKTCSDRFASCRFFGSMDPK